MKKFILSIFITLCFVFMFYMVTAPVANSMDVTVTWNSDDPTITKFNVYYDTDGVAPLDAVGSPILVDDPNARSYTITGLPYNVYYVGVTGIDAYDDEGPMSSIRRYETIEGFEVTDPGRFGENDSTSLRLNFWNTAFLNNGLMFVELNTGAKLTVNTINWASSIDIPYTISGGENADPLVVTDIYLDPNDGDVELYSSPGKHICTDIINGTNLDADPNNIMVVDTIEPEAPTGVQTPCCTN